MLAETLFLITFFAAPPQNTLTLYEEPAAYEVYAAILPSEWNVQVAHARQVVIRRETTAYRMCLNPEKESEDKLWAAISDYVEINKKQWWLQPSLTIDLPYLFVDSESLRKMFRQGRWDQFYRAYPESGGVLELSAVGFNQDKTVAVVYMGHSCGALCGGGKFHVLEKVGGKWQPLAWKGAVCSWAS
jgi:hypothetical protein